MAQNLELALRMRADLQQARRQLQQVEAELGDVARGGGQASQGMRRFSQEADRAERSSRRLSSTVGQVRNLLVTLGAGLALRQMVQYTDTMTNLESQLRLVTGSQGELNGAFQDLYRLANETRQGLEPTVNLYARMARATEELNVSHEDLLTVTKAISQSMLISGASTQEAASAMLQLSQGMASGTLRGEELNSVLENSPRLARAIADGLGVTIGQLREMGAEGELTAEKLLQAFLRTADGIDRETQGMTRTVGQAFQQLRNDLLVTFGRGEVDGFTDAIDDLRDVVTDPGFKQAVMDLGTFVADLVGNAAAAATQVGNLVRKFRELQPFTAFDLAGNLGEDLAARLNGAAAGDLPRIESEIDRVQDRIRDLRDQRDTTQPTPPGLAGSMGFTAPSVEAIDQELEELEKRLGPLKRMRFEAKFAGLRPGDPGFSGPGPGVSSPLQQADPGEPLTPPGGGGTASTGPSAAQKEYQAALQALQSLDAGMQQQIATFGESEAAVLEYRLTLGDLADDVARLGAEGEAMAAGIVEQARELERLTEAEERRAEAVRERQQAEQQAAENLQRILDQVDPARALERQLELIEQLKTQFPEYAAALDQAADQVKARIDGINNGLLSARNINAEFAYGATRAMDGFAQDLANGRNAVDSLRDAFLQFASDFLRQIAQMIMQQAIFNALQGGSGGGGGVGGILSTAIGFLTGSGGGGGGGIYNNVAAYHGGGVIDGGMAGAFRGLAPGEVPAILQQGEEVLTASDPRHRNNSEGGAGREAGTTIINTFDAGEMVSAGLATPAGERVIMNFMGRNRQKIKQTLG